MTEPKYSLRLDVSEDVSGTGALTNVTSHHLECDYANLKRLQVKLQQAVDEAEGVNSQRIMRYIS